MFVRPEERFRLHHVFGAFLARTSAPGCIALDAVDNLLRGIPFRDPRMPTLERAFPGLPTVSNRVGRLKLDKPFIQLLRTLRGTTLMRFTERARGVYTSPPAYMVSFRRCRWRCRCRWRWMRRLSVALSVAPSVMLSGAPSDAPSASLLVRQRCAQHPGCSQPKSLFPVFFQSDVE